MYMSAQSLAKQKVCSVELRGLRREMASIKDFHGPNHFLVHANSTHRYGCNTMQRLLKHCVELPKAVLEALSHFHLCALWEAIWKGFEFS